MKQVLFKLERQGKVRFEMVNSGMSWTFDNSGTFFTINREPQQDCPGNEFQLDQNGNLSIKGTLTQGSSRDGKTNVADLNTQEVLEKVLGLSVLEWEYKDDEGTKHIGPMAEDWRATFGLSDGKGIASTDAQGVALAAIQGLYRIVQEKDEQIEALSSRLAKLEEQSERAE